MINLINITQTRNNLSAIIGNVYTKNYRYVVIRDSIPQAVIIPYADYQAKEEKWQDEFRKILDEGPEIFAKWLKKNKIEKPKTEEEMYEVVNKLAGRT